MWSWISPGMFLWGVIYLKDAGTTIRALHPGVFVWSWPRPYQFAKCEGRAGARPSAAAVTDGDELNDFLTLERFRVNTRGTEEDILLILVLSQDYIILMCFGLKCVTGSWHLSEFLQLLTRLNTKTSVHINTLQTDIVLTGQSQDKTCFDAKLSVFPLFLLIALFTFPGCFVTKSFFHGDDWCVGQDMSGITRQFGHRKKKRKNKFLSKNIGGHFLFV